MDRLGLDHATLRARHPRLVYASITGYGSSGPWTTGAPTPRSSVPRPASPRPRAMPAAAPTPTIRSATPTCTRPGGGDRRSSPRCTAASTAGAGAGSTSRWPQTMLYVNEHLHDQLYDGDDDPELDPQLRPRRLPRRRDGQRRPRDDQRAPRRARDVRAVRRRLRARRPGDVGAVRHRRRPLANFAELRQRIAAAAAATSPTPRPGGAPGAARPRRRQGARGARARRVGVGRRPPGDRLRLRPPRRDDPHPQPAVALRRRPGSITGSRATAARTTAPCSASCSATTTRRSTSWRRRRAPLPSRPADRPPSGCRRSQPAIWLRSVPNRDCRHPDRGDCVSRADARAGDARAGTLESGTLAIGTLLPGVLLPGTLLPPGQPSIGRLEDLIDDVDRGVGRDDLRADDRCLAAVDHEHVAVERTRSSGR